MSKPELKVLSFPTYQKKVERKARWMKVVGLFKVLFKPKMGF